MSDDQKGQAKASAVKIVVSVVAGIILLNLIWVVGMGWFMKGFIGNFSSILGPHDEFLKYQSQLVVSDLQMFWAKEDSCAEITTLGKIKNDTDLVWQSPTLEIRYYDSSRQLIDTMTDRQYDLVLPPHAEVTFRVRGAASRPKADYVTQEVKIIWASKKFGPF